MEKLWKAGWLHSLLISLFLLFKSMKNMEILCIFILSEIFTINKFCHSWKKYGIIVETSHIFFLLKAWNLQQILCISTVSSQGSWLFLLVSFSASVVYLIVELLLFLVQKSMCMSSHGLLSCPLMCRYKTEVELWLLQKAWKKHEKLTSYVSIFLPHWLTGIWSESMVASKTVVSSWPYHCLLDIVGNHPRVGWSEWQSL